MSVTISNVVSNEDPIVYSRILGEQCKRGRERGSGVPGDSAWSGCVAAAHWEKISASAQTRPGTVRTHQANGRKMICAILWLMPCDWSIPWCQRNCDIQPGFFCRSNEINWNRDKEDEWSWGSDWKWGKPLWSRWLQWNRSVLCYCPSPFQNFVDEDFFYLRSDLWNRIEFTITLLLFSNTSKSSLLLCWLRRRSS